MDDRTNKVNINIIIIFVEYFKSVLMEINILCG